MSNDTPTQPRRPLLMLGGVCILVAAGSLAAAWRWGILGDNEPGAKEPEETAPQDRPLVLIISGDTQGWIVPCGCTSNQSGGLLRRGDYLAAARQSGDVILADAGGAPGGSSSYERLRFEAILKGELTMGVAAHNLGQPEAILGADYLRRVAEELGVPFVSANLRDTAGNDIAMPYRLVRAGTQRLAFVGVLSQQYATAGIRIVDPRDAVLETVARIPEAYDWLVVLAYVPEAELRQLSSELPEVDLLVGGPTGQSIAPTRVGPCVLTSATNKGKFLVEMRLEDEVWSGRLVEITADFADEPRQREILREFYSELARRDLTAAQSGFAPVLPDSLPSDYRIAGTTACVECHGDDCRQWEQTGHARAWESLSHSGAHVDAYCQQCHTTGFGLPGGFQSSKRTPQRYDVGCESCHGPSAAHVRHAEFKTPFVAGDQCTRCHDRENSPGFDFAAYWKQIVHGLPARDQTATGADQTEVEVRP